MEQVNMRPDEIRAHVRKQPFEPIRVFVSDGLHFDVLHHDFMIVGRHEVIVAMAESSSEFPYRTAYLDPVHVTRIEPITDERTAPDRRTVPNP